MSQAIIQPLDFRALFGLAQQAASMSNQQIKDFLVRISPADLSQLTDNIGRIYVILDHVKTLHNDGYLACIECGIEIEQGLVCNQCKIFEGV